MGLAVDEARLSKEMYMKQKPSDKGHLQPDAGAIDAETLYRRYLHLRAERDKVRNEADQSGTALKKATRGDILS